MSETLISLALAIGLAAVYAVVYLRSEKLGEGFNIAFALVTAVVMTARVVFYNSYDLTRLGVTGSSDGFVSLLICVAAFSFVGWCSIALVSGHRYPNELPDNADLGRAIAWYIPFGIVQQFLFLGILANLVADVAGQGVAIVAAGAVFGGIHARWRDWPLVCLAGGLGVVMAGIFFVYHSIWAPGIIHGILAPLMYQEIRREPQWPVIEGLLVRLHLRRA